MIFAGARRWIMKKTYYLFNSGRWQRQGGNTLKFTPYDGEGGNRSLGFTCGKHRGTLFSGISRPNSASIQFPWAGTRLHHFLITMKITPFVLCPERRLISGKMLISQAFAFNKTKRKIDLAQRLLIGALIKYGQPNIITRGEKTWNPLHLKSIVRISEMKDIAGLMGIEGNIRKNYRKLLTLIINDF